jgi:hypothetical protein
LAYTVLPSIVFQPDQAKSPHLQLCCCDDGRPFGIMLKPTTACLTDSNKCTFETIDLLTMILTCELDLLAELLMTVAGWNWQTKPVVNGTGHASCACPGAANAMFANDRNAPTVVRAMIRHLRILASPLSSIVDVKSGVPSDRLGTARI